MSEYIISLEQFQKFSDLIEPNPSETYKVQITLPKVVRCRDCKWLDHHNLYLCMLPDGDGGYACWVVEPGGFCAWGERRTAVP